MTAKKRFSQIRSEMWLDDEWRRMTVAGQHLYLLVLTHPERSLAGLLDWRPGRIKEFAAEWTFTDVMIAAGECSDKFFLVFDQDTEEVLVRSFVRHDGILKQPRMGVAVANAFGSIGSNKLRGVLVHELMKLRSEQPDLTAWDSPQMKTVLRQNPVNAKEIDTELEWPLGVELPVTLGVPLGVPREVANR
ncbi:hypothetical protein [Subtercola endophyticus]|uniref:hypothetical protein n=1 Tax=Subtercola endophyticus TaxID=2895559 RepID=UPI001E60D149|nr:hypothetical protein [Subtercola endophyticus]UFS59498.1 hypothetical protein LQ955_01470 [Subtercola endophyticus]